MSNLVNYWLDQYLTELIEDGLNPSDQELDQILAELEARELELIEQESELD